MYYAAVQSSLWTEADNNREGYTCFWSEQQNHQSPFHSILAGFRVGTNGYRYGTAAFAGCVGIGGGIAFRTSRARLAHHPVIMLKNPSQTTSFDINEKQVVATRTKLLDGLAANRTPVVKITTCRQSENCEES
jgi:hypothetical protein